MNGTITTWFKDKGFGFIKDENGDNRYVQLKDSNMVYEVGSSIVENMMSVDK